jgi:hypothetical protein
MAKQKLKEEMSIQAVADTLLKSSADVKLKVGPNGWSLEGKSTDQYRALRALLTNGGK